jgi:hypothetical protein
MLSTVTNRVFKIRMVPQIGVITRRPVRKYRLREARRVFIENGEP